MSMTPGLAGSHPGGKLQAAGGERRTGKWNATGSRSQRRKAKCLFVRQEQAEERDCGDNENGDRQRHAGPLKIARKLAEANGVPPLRAPLALARMNVAARRQR